MKFLQVLMLTAILTCAGLAQAQTWDAAADFAAVNPNGEWSYGNSNTFGQQFSTYPSMSYNDANWIIWGANWLQAYKNVSSTVNGNCSDWCVQPGQLAIHPSNTGLWSVIRFTAPYDGEFTVNATFNPIDMQMYRIRVGVAGPTGMLLDDELTYYADSTSFNQTVTLLAGETLDFGVHRGSDGTYVNDGTGIDVTISGEEAVTCGNLLVNGSFEASGPSQGWYGAKAYNDYAIPGWVVEAGSVDYGNYCPAYWESTNGIKNIDLNGGGPGTLSQTFATVPGQTYELSFRMGANNYCGVPTPTMRVSAGDTTQEFTFDRGVWNGTPLTASQWAHYGFVFTATGATTKLTFQSLSPSCGGPTLDSVWVDVAGCGGGWEETTNCFLPVVDSDGDGIPDDQDICPGFDDTLDADADGTPNGCDACPYDFFGDSDGDGLCDSEDPCFADPANDADNDGLCANDDICPLDAENDADGDGACGDVDTCPYDAANDADGDGICGNVDACPGGDDNADADSDGTADFCDVCPFDAANDADNDGLCADEDICPLDADNDADQDGLCADEDLCPLDADNDIDGDDICGDVDPCPIDVENDADGDGICESDDNCPTVANANQSNVDGDTYGDACEPDNDNDGVIDDDDNCPLDVNADQADFDGDGFGDVCDLDADGDGVIDGDDVCLGTPVGEPVLTNGCSVAQECVCEAAWKNHGAYVSCVAHASTALLKAGLITEEEKGVLCSTAGQSACGAKKKK